MKSDGVVSEGQAVRAGGGADHVGGTPARPAQNEGNKEDLQVCQVRLGHVGFIPVPVSFARCLLILIELHLGYLLTPLHVTH